MPAALLLGFLFLFPGFTEAQINPASRIDSSLAPWIGTWTIADYQSNDRAKDLNRNTVVEIRLTEDGTGIEISRKVPDQLDVNEVLIPNGNKQPVKTQDCTGWQTTKWVPEAGLLISSSEMDCKALGSMTTSTLKMILARDQMVDILAVKVAGQTRLAIRRLALRHEESPAMESQSSLAIAAARAALGRPWSLDTIIQLSRTIDTPILEAALLEKQDELKLTSNSLKKLQSAKVPTKIVDLLVALAFPDKFDVFRNGQVALRAWSSPSGGSSFAAGYAPGIVYYPGVFYNCYYPNSSFYNSFLNYGAGGFYLQGYCYNYYSPFWWDVPIYMPPYTVAGTGAPSGFESNVQATPTGGYTQIEPRNTGHHAQPRPGYGSFAGQSGGYAQVPSGYDSGASSGTVSSGSTSSGTGSGAYSPGGSSAAPSASPGGYSSGGSSGASANPR
jgi:uncharacterized membrane protein YgcG